MSHTPGPWVWDEKMWALAAPVGFVIDSAPYEGMWFAGDDEDADKRLVAAAPDLYEAARTFVRIWDGEDGFTMESVSAAENALRAAYNKALGK
jgi:hypothetical protein